MGITGFRRETRAAAIMRGGGEKGEGVSARGVEEVESWLSPSQAGRALGTSGQWVTHLARTRQLRGVKTALGWLVDPNDVQRMANERLEKAEKKNSAMKPARSSGVTRPLTRRAGRGSANVEGSASG